MELLETQNPERKKLLETSERHKRELEKEVKQVSERTEKIVKNALVIGGTLAITYLLVNQLGSGKKKKKSIKPQEPTTTGIASSIQDDTSEEVPNPLTAVGSKIVDIATIMLLDMAKEALVELLKTRKQQNADS
jgi:FtsZ-interacting cell division protein ZipA